MLKENVEITQEKKKKDCPNNILWFIKCGYQIFRMFAYHTCSEQNNSPNILILEI